MPRVGGSLLDVKAFYPSWFWEAWAESGGAWPTPYTLDGAAPGFDWTERYGRRKRLIRGQ